MKQINRLKVVLVEQNKTGKWLAETLGKNGATISRWCTNKSQPGFSKATATNEILTLLGVTENYLKEVAGINLKVIANQ